MAYLNVTRVAVVLVYLLMSLWVSHSLSNFFLSTNYVLWKMIAFFNLFSYQIFWNRVIPRKWTNLGETWNYLCKLCISCGGKMMPYEMMSSNIVTHLKPCTPPPSNAQKWTQIPKSSIDLAVTYSVFKYFFDCNTHLELFLSE